MNFFSENLTSTDMVIHISFGKQVFKATQKDLATNILALTGLLIEFIQIIFDTFISIVSSFSGGFDVFFQTNFSKSWWNLFIIYWF